MSVSKMFAHVVVERVIEADPTDPDLESTVFDRIVKDYGLHSTTDRSEELREVASKIILALSPITKEYLTND